MGDDKDDDEGPGVFERKEEHVLSELDEGPGVFERKEEYVLSELDDEGHGVLEPGGEATPKSMSSTGNPRSERIKKD